MENKEWKTEYDVACKIGYDACVMFISELLAEKDERIRDLNNELILCYQSKLFFESHVRENQEEIQRLKQEIAEIKSGKSE